MNDRSDDDIDAFLRDQFDGPVPADGFCDQVMGRLPTRRRFYRWPLATGLVAGVAACWVSLGGAAIARVGWRDLLSGEPTASAITLMVVMICLAILASAWVMMGADDRQDRPSLQIKR